MDKREAALKFLKANKAGTLATVSKEGQPHASAVYYVADDDFNIYFVTLFGSRKHKAMQANPAVAFTVGMLDVPQTLQIEGMAFELKQNEEKKEHIAEIIKVLTSNETYYAPITKLDPAEVVMMWIQPKWIRWGDYSSAQSGTNNVLTEIEVS